MKKRVILLLALCLVLPCFAARAASLYEGWTVSAPFGGITVNDLNTAEEFEAERNRLYGAWRESLSGRKYELTSGKISMDGYDMDIWFEKIGLPGENGLYPLYINLHGGGGSLEVQLEQFEYMKNPNWISSGIYIAPRAIVTGGEEHYWPEAFRFYDRIIEDAVLFHNADPDRIYLMGFSSGGDGVYVIAPMIPDRLAAAEMSAGCPSHYMFENLYNLPFRIRMGENDSAYDRNTAAARADGILNGLHARYGGYPHQTLLYAGNSHGDWNETPDGRSRVYTGENVQKWLKGKNPKVSTVNSRSVPWLSGFTRDPLPERVVWNTDAYAPKRKTRGIYWLDRDGLLEGATVVASYDRKSNSVTVEECDAERGTLKILLNPDMLDVFRPVRVNVAGRQVTVRPVVSSRIMKSSLTLRSDKRMIFTSEIDIRFDGAAKRITVQPVGEYRADYSAGDPDRLICWNDDGIFFADARLFGLTPDELGALLGVSLPKPEPWPHWGDGLYWTYHDAGDGKSVIFMFHKNRSVLIYSETPGSVTGPLERAVLDKYHRTWHVLTDGGLAWYFLENNPYNGRGHTVQQYQSIRYWFYREWQTGFGRN